MLFSSFPRILSLSCLELEYANHGLRNRFEAQLAAVKERLEAAKQGSTRGLGSPTENGGFSFGGAMGSRIAKPLRGGGGDAPHATVAGLQSENSSGSSKRSSVPWFFNK
jgi:kinesin family protein 5